MKERFDTSRPSEREAIEATAAAWLAEADDELTPERAAAFARWRAADPRHEAAVARLQAPWARLQALRDFRPEASKHPDRELLRVGSSRRRRVFRPAFFGGLALAVLAFLVVGRWQSVRDEGALRERVFATTVDGYERVLLEDGSQLELNAETEVRVCYSPEARRVRLRRGEAHFTVAKDPARPFLVQAGTLAVRAVGTAFNVRLRHDEVEVLVTEGKVALARSARTVGRRAAAGAAGIPAGQVLAANQRAVVPLSQPVPPPAAQPSVLPVAESRIERVAPEQMRQALAWQVPRLVFSDTPLVEAVAQFNRRNEMHIELADAELETIPIGGSFRPENVEAFVRLLEAGGDVEVDRSVSGAIVLRKAK